MNLRGGPLILATGIVVLEFAAAVTSFVASTLLPVIAADIGAGDRIAFLIAGSTLGLFVALPLSGRVLRRWGTRRTLAAGIVLYIGGLAFAATASNAWVFALGQFANGLASGLLAVFGVGSAIRHLGERMRTRVVAVSSAMWIVPALAGPAATLGLEHLVGWRWTLVLPVLFVLFGRLMVVGAVRDDNHDPPAQRPLGATLLIPAGAACVVLSMGWLPAVILGSVMAVAGLIAILPAGTARLKPGTPAALGALVLFAAGYFGADSLITMLLTAGMRASLGQAALVLGAAPCCWGVTSLLVSSRLGRSLPATGLCLTASGTAVLAVELVHSGPFGLTVAAWAVAGTGVGLAYPGLYIRATTAGTSGFTAAELATAVITAECTGQLLGRAVGGTLSSAGTGGLFVSYVVFAAALGASAFAARRTADRVASEAL